MSHQDQNPCPQHGEHHGICWPCADARGRKANAAEADLEAARAEVAAMQPVVEAAKVWADETEELQAEGSAGTLTVGERALLSKVCAYEEKPR